MANLDNVSDVFAGATVSGGNVVIPTGQLPKFNQGDNVAEGAELIYALVDKLQSVVAAAGHSSLSASVSNTFASSDLTMTRSYTFDNVLDITGNIDDFNVKLDPSNIVPNLALSVSDVVDYTVATDDNTTNIATITLTSDGISVDASSTDFTLSAASDVNGNWAVVNDGGVYKLRLSDEVGLTSAVSPGTLHGITISIEDNRLGYDQYPAVTASQNVRVIT